MLFMKRIDSSPHNNSKINISENNIINYNHSFSDDDGVRSSQEFHRHHRSDILMPDIENDLILFSDKNFKVPHKIDVYSPNSKNIKIVDEFEFNESQSLIHNKDVLNKSKDQKDIPPPYRDNLEDIIKERAERSDKGRESPLVPLVESLSSIDSHADARSEAYDKISENILKPSFMPSYKNEQIIEDLGNQGTFITEMGLSSQEK